MATPDDNRQIVRGVTADGVDTGDLTVSVELRAPDSARHSQATTEMPEIRGREAMLAFLEATFAAFPDWHDEIELMVAEGDKVAYVTTGTGTNTGPMGPMPPTGKPVSVVNHITQRIEDGRIAETWIEWDNLAVLAQLGLFPPPDADPA
ncbi:MAG: ester cyclase [Acidimicrobiia bacterium]